jgi:Mg2+/Co2+ transporter CorB
MSIKYLKMAWNAQKGQLSPLNLIGFAFIVVIFAALLPVVMDMVSVATNTTGVSGTVTEVVINLIPVCLALAVIMTLFAYARPYAQQG